ncbi:TerB family tellurite resistance protein [Chryseolinea lacunae]|uniref:TerB family tellurite resistance protein n=1 Tax=Chryseolinea lacunae TaxID=2801331 RepID=A0ABS1KYT6_9BACT|nr:TerB family tellurite resistance protein [Chryseolinea lacunae]MBL0744544.1 TerB family tellurite resistance protein [Chryseolinea lacunae]
MTSFFEHQRSSFKRNYLRNLIVLASADGHLESEEKALITKIGVRRGLKVWQIDELIEDKSAHTVFLPESMANRMNMLYDLMELVYVDRQVNENEILFIRNLLVSFHLPAEVMDELMDLFSNGTPGALVWRDFVDEVCAVTAHHE